MLEIVDNGARNVCEGEVLLSIQMSILLVSGSIDRLQFTISRYLVTGLQPRHYNPVFTGLPTRHYNPVVTGLQTHITIQ